MLQLIITILVGLATLASTLHLDNNDNKAQDHTFSNGKEEDARPHLKAVKRSTDCSSSDWKDSKDDGKRAWNNIQPSWGKRKWQDIQSPGWGKRSPMPPEYEKEDAANLQPSFLEDKRGWRDIQGPSWGKRGWKDMQTSAWGKRGWEDMQTSPWGKRGWKDMRTSAWGKRGWQDMQGGNWGKRGWQDMQGSSWGKRGWKDMQSSAWGKRGWKELQSSGWGKRDDHDEDSEDGMHKRGWGDMKISGYGKRAWNDIQSSGWGKRDVKQMDTALGKRSSQDRENVILLGEDWDLPPRPEVDADDMLPAAELPSRRLLGSNWRLFEPADDQPLIDKVLEGLRNSSWGNHISKSDRMSEDEAASRWGA